MSEQFLSDETATVEFGRALAQRAVREFDGNVVIYLAGDLGAGKTTLVRGVLRELGHAGAVKSPTYTLLEPYTLKTALVYHLDLYRIGHGEELAFVGLDELLEEPAIKLIEWPARAEGYLPPADISLELNVHGEGRTIREHAR